MAVVHLLHFPSTAYATSLHPLHKPQSQPLLLSSSSSSCSFLYNSKSNSHLPTCSIACHTLPLGNRRGTTFLPLTQYPLAISSSVVNVVSQTEPEVVESKSSEEEEEYSNTRLLASNIPWACTPEDIRALFGKFGTVVDIELSMHNKTRNRGLAFVTMGSPEEARAALEGLELKEFEGRTLKMNYAKLRKKKASPPPRPIQELTFSLFVANLPYDARSKDLREFFISEGANIVSAEVVFQENPRRSAGYAFVRFKTKKDAEEALKAFPGKLFKGRPLRVGRGRPFARQPKEEEKDEQSVDIPAESSSVTEQTDTTNGN